MQGSESLARAAEREVREETGLIVTAEQVLYVEEFHNSETRYCKFWLKASWVGGTLSIDAPEAKAEYIVDAAWHTEDQVKMLRVFPDILQGRYWEDRRAGFSAGLQYLGLREMAFW